MDSFDRLVEKHFPKESPLKMLMEMVENEISSLVSKRTLSEKDDILLTEDEQRFSMSIPIPRMMPSEAWGDPTSQSRQEVDRIFASITRKSGDMEGRIAHVATFLDPAAAVKKAPGGQVNTLLNMMQIIEALQAALNDFNESASGFVFEGFMAALTGGRQEAERVGGTLPIEDFITADNENVSLKLLSPKTPIHGSFTNLIDYLFIRGGTGVPYIKYLVARKMDEDNAVAKLAFWDFLITRDNLIDIFDITKNTPKLLGNQGPRLKQHIANYQDTPEWKMQMRQILLQTSYNSTLGMFVKNISPEGEFFIDPKGGPDPETKRKAAAKDAGRGRLSDLIDAARIAGAEAFETGLSLDQWLKDLDWATNPDLPASPTSETRKKMLVQVTHAWNKGFEEARKKQEQEKKVVAESYFGAFHEDEKRWYRIDEQTLLEVKGKENTKSQFSISPGHVLDIKTIADSKYYGILDMSQNNINQLVKIYVEKLGEDLMTLLENTKNFSESIGRYFSVDDRTEAAMANRTARDQGKEIVTSLEEREKEEIKPEQ